MKRKNNRSNSFFKIDSTKVIRLPDGNAKLIIHEPCWSNKKPVSHNLATFRAVYALEMALKELNVPIPIFTKIPRNKVTVEINVIELKRILRKTKPRISR